MRKEIDEQPAAIRDTLVGRVVDGRLALDELHVSDDVLREVTKVFVVACGTAFHSGLVAKYAIEHWTRLPVEIEIASEFRYRDPVLGPDTLTLAVSQSGETIDTLEAARHARRQGSQVIAVTNTVGSSLAREADGVLYMHAGPEIGVAATKTFATQMVSQYLVALYLAQVRGSMFPEEIAEVLARIDELPEQVERRARARRPCRELAERYRDARDVLFIGRHTGYPAALEGALKLKELSYVHAEGYPAGELKHGPIALVEEGVPVVAVATQCHVYPKMLSNIQEVSARGAEVIAVATEGDTEIAELADHVLGCRDAGALAPVVGHGAAPALRVPRRHAPRLRRRPAAEPREVRHRGVERAGSLASPARLALVPRGDPRARGRHLRDRPDGAGARSASHHAAASVHAGGDRVLRLKARPAESFAGRFAAREATIKALGGYRGRGWQDISVTRHPERGAQIALDRQREATRRRPGHHPRHGHVHPREDERGGVRVRARWPTSMKPVLTPARGGRARPGDAGGGNVRRRPDGACRSRRGAGRASTSCGGRVRPRGPWWSAARATTEATAWSRRGTWHGGACACA